LDLSGVKDGVVKSENRKPNVDKVELSDEYKLIKQSPSNLFDDFRNQ